MLCFTGLRKACFYLPVLLWDYSVLIRNLDKTEKKKPKPSLILKHNRVVSNYSESLELRRLGTLD